MIGAQWPCEIRQDRLYLLELVLCFIQLVLFVVGAVGAVGTVAHKCRRVFRSSTAA